MGLFGSNKGEIVTFARNGDIKLRLQSKTDAQLAIKQLRLRKKELSANKRLITSQEQAIRSEYTDHVRRQGSKFRGGGGFGRFVRDVQTGQRDSARRELAKKLQPLDKSKYQLDRMMAAVGQALARVESYILRNAEP